MTAPRETGAEGREALLEQIAWAQGLSLISEDTRLRPDAASYVKPSEYRDIVRGVLDDVARWLATPRPVEVTEEVDRLRALVEGQEHWFACRVKLPEGHISKGDGSCDCDRGKMLATLDILTAALRAQPAGGTEIAIPKDISAGRLEVLLTWKQEVESYGYTVPVVTPHPDLFVARLIAFADALRPAPVADAGGTPELPALRHTLHNAVYAPTLPPVGERNWPEDFSHENGQYYNKCTACGFEFKGGKYRSVCRLCMARFGGEPNDAPPVGERETHALYDPKDLRELLLSAALVIEDCLAQHSRSDASHSEVDDKGMTRLFFLLREAASRPSPAPSGEPVEWQLCARKQGSEPWGPTRPRSWMRYDAATERDRVAANLAREHIVETRELYAAAPHPDGQGVG